MFIPYRLLLIQSIKFIPELHLFKDSLLLATIQFKSSVAGAKSLFIHSPIFAGFFVYFEDLQLTRSPDCDQDYVQFGRDILFITSYRSEKFCDRIQVPTIGINSRFAMLWCLFDEKSNLCLNCWKFFLKFVLAFIMECIEPVHKNCHQAASKLGGLLQTT